MSSFKGAMFNGYYGHLHLPIPLHNLTFPLLVTISYSLNTLNVKERSLTSKSICGYLVSAFLVGIFLIGNN